MNYEKLVKSKFPDAACIGVSTTATGASSLYMIIGVGIGENYRPSKELAWENAYGVLMSKSNNNSI